MSPWSRRLAFGWAVVSMALLGQLPLFRQPGYEVALAAGLLLPAAAALLTAAESCWQGWGGFAAYARGFGNGAKLALVGYLVSFVRGLLGGFCDLGEGTLLFLLGPTIGCLLAGVWGALAAQLARRWTLRKRHSDPAAEGTTEGVGSTDGVAPPSRRFRAVALLLGLSLPLGTVLFHVGLFYFSPAVFTYDPFVGYFSGVLFDTVLDYSRLWSYRAASGATLLCGYLVALHLRADERGRWRWHPLQRRGMLLLAGLLGGGSLLSVVQGHKLGHWHTASTIEAALGGEVRHGRCRLVHDRRLDPAHAQRLAAECEQHLQSLEAWIGRRDDRPITAFVFSSPGQKQAYMGAAHTSIAKPWRHEIYLHNSAYPHRVMRHELAHVLGARIARGPFRIAGKLGGWLPDPGLIEGFAEAAAPRVSELSAMQWSAAMRQIGVLPRLGNLFSLAFFGNAASTSYVAAGSFVTLVHRRFGADTVAGWYGGGSLPELTGLGWDKLEQLWWQELDAVTLSKAELVSARRRFDRPSIFGRRCPHVVDARLGFANERVGSGDVGGALEAYHDVLRLDPGNVNAMLGVARCHERVGAAPKAIAALDSIAKDERLILAARALARERLADLHWRRAEFGPARRLYTEVLALTTSEDRRRTLDIKLHYLEDPLASAALLALLVGRDERGPQHDEALDRLGRWRAAAMGDGTPDYLLARQHFNAGSYALALEGLDVALAKTLLPTVERESLRMQVVSACAVGEHATAQAAVQRAAVAGTASVRLEHLRALVARCSRVPR